MKKLLIIGFYELKDYLVCIKEQFEMYYYTVIEYPLFRYAYDSYDKKEDYKEHLNKYINDNKPDIILWWFFDIPFGVMKYIKEKHSNIIYIMFNYDDPLNINNELYNKASLFDIVCTPCKGNMYKYKLYSNVNTVIYTPFGFDTKIFKSLSINDIDILKKNSDNYECDISMVCYNMYMDKNHYSKQYIYKPELIRNIINYCKEKNKIFKLYGPMVLKEYYPEVYNGDIAYHNLNLLFNMSKINIITHPVSDISLSLDQYVMSILGSGGLLLIDEIKDIDKLLIDEHHCMYLNKTKYIEQIDEILSDINRYDIIKEDAYEYAQKFTWNQWVKTLISEIGIRSFDPNLYAELYDLDKNNDLLSYWKNEGISKKDICYKFNVPTNFDHENYKQDHNLKDNIYYTYLHWFLQSKDEKYMKHNGGKTSVDLNKLNISMEQYYDICMLLNKISKYNTIDKGFNELNNICNAIPYINIMEIIDNYVNSVY